MKTILLSKNEMQNFSYWDHFRNKIRSKKGGWVIGKGVFCHGFDMMKDLVGQVSYMQVIILNATGRLPEKRIADWFEACHICLSWPDPRIWCNHIGALGGTVRTSAVAATVAGVLGADSRAYGGSTVIEGMRFIKQALTDFNDGKSVENIVETECKKHKGKPLIMGYARPIAKGDERIEAMEKVASKLGFLVGDHLSLAYNIEKILIDRFQEGMNINGYFSAFMCDQGFAGEEFYRISTMLTASGVTACYIDTRDKPANTFLPLRCEDIEYTGKPDRLISV